MILAAGIGQGHFCELPGNIGVNVFLDQGTTLLEAAYFTRKSQ